MRTIKLNLIGLMFLRWIPSTAIALLLFSSPSVQAEETQPFRGAWIHLNALYNYQDSIPDREVSIAKALDDCKRVGLDSIIPFALSSSGVAQYQSEIVPENQFEDWDPLGAVVREARKRDLSVYIAVPVLVCGHDEPQGILREHPEWAVIGKEGKPLGYICGGNLEARKWVLSVVEELVRKYQPEGIMLDYLRFPNKPVDVDPQTRERFLQQSQVDSYDITDRNDQSWQDFKQKCLMELAGQIRETVDRAKPGTQIAIYTWGDHVVKNHFISQDWVTMAKNGYLDLINVSGYMYEKNYGKDFLTKFEGKMRNSLSLLKDTDHPVEFAFVLGVITSHGQVNSAAEIEDYLDAAERAGIEGISVFTLTYLQPFIDELIQRGNWTRILNSHVRE